jgi:drug/metabolite transporter (DMT)-like permease
MNKNMILGLILLLTSMISTVLYASVLRGPIQLVAYFVAIIIFGGMMFAGLFFIDRYKLEKRKKEQNDQR